MTLKSISKLPQTIGMSGEGRMVRKPSMEAAMRAASLIFFKLPKMKSIEIFPNNLFPIASPSLDSVI